MDETVWTPIEEIQVDDVLDIFEDRVRVTDKFWNESDIRLHLRDVNDVPAKNSIVSLTAYRGAKLQVVK